MTSSVVWLRSIILIALSGAALAVWFPVIPVSAGGEQYLSVRFLDVGQGDAIHVMTPDGYEMLVDGGPSAAVLRELSGDRSFFDHSIDVVIATHPDTDHVAGLVDVLERYDVDWLVKTAAKSDSAAAVAYEAMAISEGAQFVSAQAGQIIKLGASTTVRILSPRGDTTNWQSNSASVIVQVVYGETEFMLTGDAPSSIEEFLVTQYGSNLESDVLKLGHHGSDTSSSAIFLETVQPKYAVVSAGTNNRYGHPREEVLDRAHRVGAEIVSTAEQGTITFQSDGEQVWIK